MRDRCFGGGGRIPDDGDLCFLSWPEPASLAGRKSTSLFTMTDIFRAQTNSWPKIDETDPLLDDGQGTYGGIGGEDVPQPDEEELRRDREAMEQITSEATECVYRLQEIAFSNMGRQ